MSKELKTKAVLFALAMLMTLYGWWANGALAEEQFMIWFGFIFIVGVMDVFGFCWDLAVFAFNKLRNQ